MIARFKEHTQNGHVKIRKQQLRRRRSHVVLACTDSPEFDHAGGVEPGPAGSKATATVFHAVTPHRPIGVCTYSWTHTGESDVRLTSSALLAGLRLPIPIPVTLLEVPDSFVAMLLPLLRLFFLRSC